MVSTKLEEKKNDYSQFFFSVTKISSVISGVTLDTRHQFVFVFLRGEILTKKVLTYIFKVSHKENYFEYDEISNF